MQLNQHQISILKSTRISFSLEPNGAPWIDRGIAVMPVSGVQAEDYSSYIVPTHFHSIGAFSYSWSPFLPFVSIGRYSSIAGGVEIIPDGHPTDLFTTSSMLYDPTILHRARYYADNGYETDDLMIGRGHHTNNQPIRIGNDVYICTGAKLRSGIEIGDGAIIAAYAVVTKSVPPYSMVAGNPATVRRMRYTPEQIARLRALAWWDWDFKAVLALSKDAAIDLFMDRLETEISENRIARFSPTRHSLSQLLSAGI